MKFKVIPPPDDRLKPLVEDFFTIHAGETVKNDRMALPTNRQYLIFHLKGEATYTCKDLELKISDGCLLCHVQTSVYSIKVSSNFEAIGVSLSPNGLYRLFGRSFRRGDSFLSHSEAYLESRELNVLCMLLNQAPEEEEKLHILEKFLSPGNQRGEEGDIVDRFLHFMGDFRKEITTREIASALFTNIRSLELKFCAITGTTPGRYIRLQRFNRLICDMASKRYKMRDLVVRHNYSDYSHMRRDIRKFSGVSIKELASAKNLENTPIGPLM